MQKEWVKCLPTAIAVLQKSPLQRNFQWLIFEFDRRRAAVSALVHVYYRQPKALGLAHQPLAPPDHLAKADQC